MNRKIKETKGRDKTGGKETKFTFGDTLGDSKGRGEPQGLDIAEVRRIGVNKKNAMDYDKKTSRGKKDYASGKLVSPEANDSID